MYMYVAHNYLKGQNILISLHLFCAIINIPQMYVYLNLPV